MNDLNATAAALAFLSETVGLVLIPGVAYLAALKGGGKSLCCVLSWIAAVMWGFGFCLLLAAWSFEVTPGWELFPEGPGAMPFFLFGWVGGLIGHAIASGDAKLEPSKPGHRARRAKLMLGITLISASVIAVCIIAIYFAGQRGIRDLRVVEFPTESSGIIVRQMTGIKKGRMNYEISLGHKVSADSPVVEITRLEQDIRMIRERPQIWEGGGLLATVWKPRYGAPVLGIRTSSGQWKQHEIGDSLVDAIPRIQQEIDSHFGYKRRGFVEGIDTVDLSNRLVQLKCGIDRNYILSLRIDEDDGRLRFEKINWPKPPKD